MGGYSFNIMGSLDESWNKKPVSQQEAGDRFVVLRDAITTWFADQMSDPMSATHVQANESFIEYLADSATLYIAPIVGPSKYSHVLSLAFSGGAGTSEHLAELAVHWTERWWNESAKNVRSLLQKSAGFKAQDFVCPELSPHSQFFPLRDGGYAVVRWSMPPPMDRFPLPGKAPLIEWPYWLEPSSTDVQSFERAVSDAMSDKRCRCLMCDRGFERHDNAVI